MKHLGIKKVQKNMAGYCWIFLPAEYVKKVGLRPGDRVEARCRGDKLIVRKYAPDQSEDEKT